MRTVTISVESRDDASRRVLAAFDGREQGAYISFPSIEQMSKTLTAKRWELLRAMTGQGPMTIREAARRVGRDTKSVHRDTQALRQAGVLDLTDEGRLIFPYDAIHVDCMVYKVA